MKFICYPKCTTCKKAQKWLDENQISYECRDIKEDNPSREELDAWYRISGQPLKKFFNTSGLQYKALQLKDKLPNMSEEEQQALYKGIMKLDQFLKEQLGEPLDR